MLFDSLRLVLFLTASNFIESSYQQTQNRLELSSVVQLDVGSLRGTLNYTVGQNKPYYAFRGIPYATPPVGNLRFEPPEPAKPWNGILHATEDRTQCVQTQILPPTVLGTEDCLYINVYTPNLPSGNNTSFLPVMVYVFGGAFVRGNSSYVSNAPDYFLDENVVFVIFNYRLGILGFASTGDLTLPGNNGLKDQFLALKWVKNNIAQFGGDNSKITIFGESAGSVAVSYLVQLNATQGLYHSAIMQSGTSLCLWGLSRSASEILYKIGSSLGVNTNSSQTLVEGLKKIDYQKLQTASTSATVVDLIANNPLEGLIFGPVKEPAHEGAIFSGKSHEMIKAGQFHRVPTIIGFNSAEASIDVNLLIRLYLLKFDTNFSALVPIDLNIKKSTQKARLGFLIKTHYFGITPIALDATDTIKFISDFMFYRPIRQSVLEMSIYSTVFFYKFSYVGSLGGNRTGDVEGVHHDEELNYLFAKNISSTEQDRTIRFRMVKLWTNFAKYKNPTPSPTSDLQNIKWVQAQPNKFNIEYLDIDSNLQMKVNPLQRDLKFWDFIYKKFGNPPFDTY